MIHTKGDVMEYYSIGKFSKLIGKRTKKAKEMLKELLENDNNDKG